jgi:hypothetical protein
MHFILGLKIFICKDLFTINIQPVKIRFKYGPAFAPDPRDVLDIGAPVVDMPEFRSPVARMI